MKLGRGGWFGFRRAGVDWVTMLQAGRASVLEPAGGTIGAFPVVLVIQDAVIRPWAFRVGFRWVCSGVYG